LYRAVPTGSADFLYCRRGLYLLRGSEKVGNMGKATGLLPDSLHYFWMGIPESVYRDPCQQIQVFFSIGVPHAGAQTASKTGLWLPENP